MKRLVLLITVIALFLCSCAKNTTTELTTEQKATIISEVKQVFELSLDGIKERNAEKAFSIFSNKEGTKYIRDGHLYPSIDTAINQYTKWFSIPGPEQKVTCDPMLFDILDENTVLVTTIGSFEKDEIVTPDQKPWIIAYTMVYRKEDKGWKLFHMHNSWE